MKPWNTPEESYRIGIANINMRLTHTRMESGGDSPRATNANGRQAEHSY